ncbi:hypothetical protein AVEN_9614-1 [Araneus ventricosus]|uniref:Uncharacterized protein n=1 Tax=Araneus ventricosus TaxID=182803 RepID=A0A4Y2TV81_ARAVE|nr:hypothetical protein AVEN_9614-1 [Araneus ventricosus]
MRSFKSWCRCVCEVVVLCICLCIPFRLVHENRSQRIISIPVLQREPQPDPISSMAYFSPYIYTGQFSTMAQQFKRTRISRQAVYPNFRPHHVFSSVFPFDDHRVETLNLGVERS